MFKDVRPWFKSKKVNEDLEGLEDDGALMQTPRNRHYDLVLSLLY